MEDLLPGLVSSPLPTRLCLYPYYNLPSLLPLNMNKMVTDPIVIVVSFPNIKTQPGGVVCRLWIIVWAVFVNP